MAFLPTNASQVQQFAVALYGIQVGSSTMAQVQADITSIGGLNKALNAYYAASFGSSTTAAVAATVAANLGLTGTAATDAAAYITAVLNGTAASARGEAIQGVLSLFSTLTANATFGAAATAWNTKVAAAVSYAGAGDVALVAGVTQGNVFTLTTDADELTGSSGNDVFNAKQDAGDDTITATDVIDGGAGNDTLNASVAADVAIDTTSVETINITALAAAELTLASDVTTLSVAKGAANAVTAVAAGLTTLNVTKSEDVTVTNVESESVAINVTVEADTDAVVTVEADDDTKLQVTNVTVTGETTGTASTLEVGAVTATTLKVIATGDLDLTLTGATLVEALTVTGAGDVTITDGGAEHEVLTSFDASGLAGGVTAELAGEAAASVLVTVNGGSGDDDLAVTDLATAGVISTGAGDDTIETTDVQGTFTVDAGAGNDTVTINDVVSLKAAVINGGDGDDEIDTSAVDGVYATTGTKLAVDAGAGDDTVIAGDIALAKSTVTFEGGAGTDIIRITGDFGLAESKLISGFEVVDVTDNGAGEIDLSRESSIRTIQAADGTADVTLINVAAGTAILAHNTAGTKAAVADDADIGTITYELEDASGKADSLTVTLETTDGYSDGDADGSVTLTLVAEGIETLNVASTLVSVDTDKATTVADESTKASSYAANVLDVTATTIKAIVVTGNQAIEMTLAADDTDSLASIDASAATGGVTVDLGDSTSTAGVNFLGGSGADDVTGAGDSVIDAGTGADTIAVLDGDTLVYDSVSDSKLVLNKAGTAAETTAAKFTWDVVADFASADDTLIDLSAFNFAAGARVAVKNASAADIDAMALGTASTCTDFFKEGTVKKYFATVGDYLVIDANKDGNFSAADDLFIELTGLADDIAITDFVL